MQLKRIVTRGIANADNEESYVAIKKISTTTLKLLYECIKNWRY